MKKIILLFIFTVIIQFDCVAKINYEEELKISDFTVRNGLIKDERFFMAEGEEVINASLEKVLIAAASFQDRCNQKLNNKRKFTEKDKVCPYHNPSLVESVIIRDFNKVKKEANLLDDFLIWRNVFNRNSYSYYHHVLIRQINKKEVHIKFSMLQDNEVKNYLNDFIKRDTAFKTSGGEYFIKSVGKNKTNVKMLYYSSTNHWLLSSSVAKGTIMQRIGEGSRRTLNAIKSAVEQN